MRFGSAKSVSNSAVFTVQDMCHVPVEVYM
jgi:hypothetical protein